MKLQNLEVRLFDKKHLTEVVNVIHATIKTCYPEIYAPEVVDFFLDYHSEQNIVKKSSKGEVYTFYLTGELIGTGYLVEDEIGGLYILPNFQNKGYGSEAMNFLLNCARQKGLKNIWIDATPASNPLYLHLGFKLIEEKVMYVEGDVPLPYSYMEYCF